MGQCPKCGAAVRPDQPSCVECGTDLTESRSQATARPAAAATTKPRRKAGFSIGMGLGLEAVVALTVGLIFQWFISSVVPADAYLYRLFRPSGGWVMSVVPGLISFVFVWALIDLVLKFRIARVNERDVRRTEVRQLPSQLAQENPTVTLQRVRAWDRTLLTRPVGRRVLWLLHHLGTTDAQRAHELVRHQSDVDADAAASGYRAVKLFIWAMPILGFIGTVLGISLAVGGFSEFLTSTVSIDQVDAVTAELGEVASGLSFAFDTTLLGLLAGLVSNVVSSGVQSREERLLTRLEELGLRIMAAAQASANAVVEAAAPAPVAGGASEAFEQMLNTRLREVQAQMDQFARTVQAGLDGMRETSSKMNSGLAQSIGTVRQTVDGLGKEIESVSGTLSVGMSGLGRDIEGVSGTLSKGMTGLGDRVTSMEAANGRSEQAMQNLSASVAELGQRLQEYQATQAALGPVLSQLAGPLELRLIPSAPPAQPAAQRPPVPPSESV